MIHIIIMKSIISQNLAKEPAPLFVSFVSFLHLSAMRRLNHERWMKLHVT